ncbi:MAG: Asp-tRNA(Asn)/Glu-tRNA(Gln) amidotransferase subunit GatA, partial [Bdellovibrionales bacterium]|nr:Asp-tRNA(Asn)/Glu-tRNA(Gln) amidotransferase subunit GatA [Bdellovibrionales bacterium]
IAPYDATAVAKLKTAGAIVIGKTNLDEFAMGSSNENSYFGAVKNPWNTSRVPGGSSGGSAAAVAARMVPGSLGTDTGGSIRQPASFCGVVGLKPTYGRVSRYGAVAFASSLDQIGPMGKSVKDVAILTECISGRDDNDSTSMALDVPNFSGQLKRDLKGLRIGIPKEYFVTGLNPEVESAVRSAITKLESLGMVAVEVSLPHTSAAIPAYYILAPAEASSNLARFDGVRFGHRSLEANSLLEMYCQSRSQGFGPEVKRRIMMGTYVLSAGYYDAYYLRAQKIRRLIANDFKSAFEANCDVIVCPTAPTTAFALGEKVKDPLSMYLNDIFTGPLNLAGLPGLSMPCGFDSNGLPIGVQLIGKAFDELSILQVAYAYEQATDWLSRKP